LSSLVILNTFMFFMLYSFSQSAFKQLDPCARRRAPVVNLFQTAKTLESTLNERVEDEIYREEFERML